jgi:hypothetical protein
MPLNHEESPRNPVQHMPEDVTRGVNLSMHLPFESGVLAVAAKMKSENEEMCQVFLQRGCPTKRCETWGR